MPTISQLVREGRKKIVSKTKSPALQNSPQKRGVCVRVFTQTPRFCGLFCSAGLLVLLTIFLRPFRAS